VTTAHPAKRQADRQKPAKTTIPRHAWPWDPAPKTGMAGATLAETFSDLFNGGGNMCQHQPRCPEWPAPDHLAARIVADQSGQGWNLLCNGVILFNDGGELLPDGRAVTPDRDGLAHLVAMAA
jgi:Family of unknown function (DUF5999)